MLVMPQLLPTQQQVSGNGDLSRAIKTIIAICIDRQSSAPVIYTPPPPVSKYNIAGLIPDSGILECEPHFRNRWHGQIVVSVTQRGVFCPSCCSPTSWQRRPRVWGPLCQHASKRISARVSCPTYHSTCIREEQSRPTEHLLVCLVSLDLPLFLPWSVMRNSTEIHKY